MRCWPPRPPDRASPTGWLPLSPSSISPISANPTSAFRAVARASRRWSSRRTASAGLSLCPAHQGVASRRAGTGRWPCGTARTCQPRSSCAPTDTWPLPASPVIRSDPAAVIERLGQYLPPVGPPEQQPVQGDTGMTTRTGSTSLIRQTAGLRRKPAATRTGRPHRRPGDRSRRDHLEIPAGPTVLDGTGRTLLPGLIDAHTHISDTAQLRQALVFGIMAELDMGGSAETARRMRAAANERDDLADVLRGRHGRGRHHDHGRAAPPSARAREERPPTAGPHRPASPGGGRSGARA